MADAVTIDARMLGGGRVIDTVTGQFLPAIFGRGLVAARRRSFTSGTGSGQVNKLHVSRRTLAHGASDLLDLAGGITDFKGAAITLTALKWAYVAIIDPDGTKALRIGPQNQSNALQGWWGGTGATVYHTTKTDWEFYEPVAGAAVGAGSTDVFPVINQSGVSVTYALILAGVG